MTTRMKQEAESASEIIRWQLTQNKERFAELGRYLRTNPPQHVITLARGSSDHAVAYLAYLLMLRLGKVVASLPMSLITAHHAVLDVSNALVLSISQSGQSPDVVLPMRQFRAGGAATVALVNQLGSPLADAAEWIFGLEAGQENSIAATKSFIASLVSGARLVAHWQNEPTLLAAIHALPDALQKACHVDWSAAMDVLAPADKIMVIGRGTGFPVAQEMALKFKETCALQAEAFSGAEIQHGPMALIEDGYPLLIVATPGPTLSGLVQLASDMRARGANVLLVAPATVMERDLTLADSPTDDLAPIMAIQTFYLMAEQLARVRGLDPDAPRHLKKVTITL